jgi:hypothetical protein
MIGTIWSELDVLRKAVDHWLTIFEKTNEKIELMWFVSFSILI